MKYEARYDGEVWSAGRMVEVGETLGYFNTREEAQKACDDYKRNDFDDKHIQVSIVELEDKEAITAVAEWLHNQWQSNGKIESAMENMIRITGESENSILGGLRDCQEVNDFIEYMLIGVK